jgi:hypothetical protein
MLIILVFLYYFGFAASVPPSGRFSSGVRPHLPETPREKFVCCWVDHRGHREHGDQDCETVGNSEFHYWHDGIWPVAPSIPQITPSGFPPRRLHTLFPFGGLRLRSVHLVSIPGLRPHGFLAQAILLFICSWPRLVRFKTPIPPVIRIPVVFRKTAVSMAFYSVLILPQGAGLPAPIHRDLPLNSSDKQSQNGLL